MTRWLAATLVGVVSVLGALAITSGSTAAQRAPFEITLLGTGARRPIIDRLGPSTLIRTGDIRLLFDAGRGVPIRLTQAGVPLRDVNAVFLTHLHSDHVSGLADLWLTGWLPPPYGQRSVPFRVYGPRLRPDRHARDDDHLERAHAADIRIRIADELLPPAGAAIEATDVTESIVFDRDGVRVTVFGVDHGELIKPSLGYRVDFGGRSVVLSGDTRYSPNLLKYATGADVLIHEVVAIAGRDGPDHPFRQAYSRASLHPGAGRPPVRGGKAEAGRL